MLACLKVKRHAAPILHYVQISLCSCILFAFGCVDASSEVLAEGGPLSTTPPNQMGQHSGTSEENFKLGFKLGLEVGG